MGLFKKLGNIAEKGVDIIDQTVLDKDKANELKTDLIKTISQHLLTGSGASFTKITICILVGSLVFTGIFVFLLHPDRMIDFKDLALSLTPLIGILIGAYGTGTTVQKVMKK